MNKKKDKKRKKGQSKRAFKWVTDDGWAMRPKDMASNHIYNSIKMMFNNSMPPALRVDSFIRRPIGRITKDLAYMEQAVFELTRELMSRPDYDLYEGYINDMAFNLELWTRLHQRRILTIVLS